MTTRQSKILNPESWTEEIDELGELQTAALNELITVKFGVVISPTFKTASGGERIHIFHGSMRAYDSDNRIVWKLLQNTNDNILTLNKRDDDGYGNALNIQDDSDDGHASINVEYTGNSATKDLVHLELASTMTQARVGQSIELEGGTVEALLSCHAKAGTATSVGYFESDLAAGKVLFAFQDNASNTNPAGYFRVDAVQQSHFYKVLTLDAAGSTQISFWIGDQNPHGTLSGNSGDVCLSTEGKMYICSVTTAWQQVAFV